MFKQDQYCEVKIAKRYMIEKIICLYIILKRTRNICIKKNKKLKCRVASPSMLYNSLISNGNI